MLIMLLQLLSMQPQIVSFSYFNRKFFKGIWIFAFNLAASFLLLSKRWACGLEYDIFATKGYPLWKLLL